MAMVHYHAGGDREVCIWVSLLGLAHPWNSGSADLAEVQNQKLMLKKYSEQ